VVVVAAGNENDDACEYSPAFALAAITVGSTRSTDVRSVFSNYGNCVDIFAPGTDITSSSSSGDHAAATYSGTSMACPHVSGAVALLRAGMPSASASDIIQKVIQRATIDIVTDAKGSPPSLLYVGVGDNDDTVTHHPTSPPNSDCETQGWKVLSGGSGCEIDADCCLTSPNYDTSSYDNDQSCRIQVGTSPGAIHQEHFNTETDYDVLRIPTVDRGMGNYHGDAGPHDIKPQPQGTILWSSDHSIVSSGFKLCLPNINECPETGWMPAEVCPETWLYKGELVHGCTTRDHSGGWCMRDDGTQQPVYVHWWDPWMDCSQCN